MRIDFTLDKQGALKWIEHWRTRQRNIEHQEGADAGKIAGFFTELRVLSQIYYSLSPMWQQVKDVCCILRDHILSGGIPRCAF
ncbi:hypothetical protein Dda3937_00797 [Dickeya dadantii 3937]|uniref:Uncharacterized protein n=1 Tax=Dickeya dadantii (strain 3937) TaxID=198628 RepID=E0SGP8_DICD3|nr:hypothetical protein Dda3937_00797 [Dickeya dadantii 3937]